MASVKFPKASPAAGGVIELARGFRALRFVSTFVTTPLPAWQRRLLVQLMSAKSRGIEKRGEGEKT